MDISHILRQLKAAVLTVTIFGTYLLCTANPDRVCVAQDTRARAQEARGKLGIRLRSFVIGATGTLNFEPTMEGGVVRLTAIGLPSPPVIMPNARAFVIYAVAPNNPTIRIGELPTDANGNGGLEFPRPASFERYSVIVSAELTPTADSPKGTMVFATKSGAVKAFYGERNKNLGSVNAKRLSKSGDYTRLRRVTSDFYDEVDLALNTNGGGRVLEFLGEEVAPNAQGLARVTTLNNKGYLRALFKMVPPLERVNANHYVLWAVEPSGRVSYMGSLPSDLRDTEVFVRAGSFNQDNFDLFVTAEMRRPLSRPSSRRALSTDPSR